ncbi:MAG: thymidylate synthase [Candidatus Woesearchaeota archaeon]|nr:thymidylate synthase [Candidatus Woesearchaeota archaeon]
MRIENWPIHFGNLVKKGNLDSNVVVITLWTPMKIVEPQLRSDSYAVLSQLYSKDTGLNALVRGCLSNTAIRYVIVTGQDLSGSGQALLNLKNNGVDATSNIIGSTNSVVDKEIPKEAVELFRKNVDIVDARTVPFPQLQALIDSLPKKSEYGQPRVFPEAKIEVPETQPSEHVGFKVRAKKIGEAWLQALQLIMKFGAVKESQRGEKQKEVMELMISVTDENPDAISWKEYFNFTQEDLENYYPQVLSPQTLDVKYTYGSRLMNYHSIDQIQSIIDELKKAPHSRRAVAVLWDVEKDSASEDPPCFNLLQALIQNNKLFLIMYIRSNDMYDAWPRNAFALRKLQQRIAQEVGCAMGHLITLSGSAHIYERSFKQVDELLKDYPVADNVEFDLPGKLMQDPRGNITISITGTEIKLSHLTPDGKRIDEHTAKSAKDAMFWLTWQQKIIDVYHALYLGRELEKAEMALQLGIHYVQDKPLDMKEIMQALQNKKL